MASTATSRDLREGGAWSSTQARKNDVLHALVRAGVALVGRLSRSQARAAGRLLGALAHALLGRERRIARDNLRLAFPELDEASVHVLARRTFVSLGEELGATAVTLDPARKPRLLPFAPGAEDALARASASGCGVVLASAHLGPWESVAATLVAAGTPLSVVAREPYDPRLAFVYERLRGGHDVRAIYRGSAGAARAMLRVLRAGEVLGIPMDLRSRVPSVDVPFFGRLAPTVSGPARLALRVGAAMVVATPVPTWDGDGLALAIEAVETADLDVADPASTTVLTARLAGALEARIRALPHLWPWMHERWPPGRPGDATEVTTPG